MNWMICKHINNGAPICQEAFCVESTTALCEICHQEVMRLKNGPDLFMFEFMEKNFVTVCESHMFDRITEMKTLTAEN